jgi:hypothetical protein
MDNVGSIYWWLEELRIKEFLTKFQIGINDSTKN